MTPEKPPKSAVQHGYRKSTLSKKKCGVCKHGVGARDGVVHCRMFDFMASERGTCDEWAPE